LRSVTRERYQLNTNNDKLNRALNEEKRLREQEKKEHEHIVKDIVRSKESKTETGKPTEAFLITENARFRQENDRLSSAASSSQTPISQTSPPSSYSPGSIFNPRNRPLSPVPSRTTCLSEEEKKNENIRKTYITVKKRFDNLHAASVNVSRCTQGMDLTSSGEFGQYVRQLGRVLEEDGNEMGQAMVARRREDGDAK
jgi:hypothetical protein